MFEREGNRGEGVRSVQFRDEGQEKYDWPLKSPCWSRWWTVAQPEQLQTTRCTFRITSVMTARRRAFARGCPARVIRTWPSSLGADEMFTGPLLVPHHSQACFLPSEVSRAHFLSHPETVSLLIGLCLWTYGHFISKQSLSAHSDG
jgi:hypothetical protein